MNISKINNPFDRRDRVTVITDTSHETVMGAIEKIFPEIIDSPVNYFISVNGKIVNPYTTYIKDSDFIALIPYVGEGKNAGAIIAMIGVAIFASWAAGSLAPALAGGATTGTWFNIVHTSLTMGIMIGGGLLISSLLPPTTEDTNDNSSKVYQWSERTTQKDRIPKPRYYGRNLLSGNIITVFTEVKGVTEEQFLNVILGISMGPCKGVVYHDVMIGGETVSVPKIKLNDQYIEQYEGVEVEESKGFIDQDKFENFDVEAIQGISSRVTIDGFTTEIVVHEREAGNSFEYFTPKFTCPNGLYRPNDTEDRSLGYYLNFFTAFKLEVKSFTEPDSAYRPVIDYDSRQFEVFGFKKIDDHTLGMIVSSISTSTWEKDSQFNIDNLLIPSVGSGYNSPPKEIVLQDLPDGIIDPIDKGVVLKVKSYKSLYLERILNIYLETMQWYNKYGNSQGVNKGNRHQKYILLKVTTTGVVSDVPPEYGYIPAVEGFPYGMLVDTQIVKSARTNSELKFEAPKIYYEQINPGGLLGNKYNLRITKTVRDKPVKVNGILEPATTWGQKLQYDSVTEAKTYESTYPRLACIGMKALASRDINGGFDFSCEYEGLYVRVFDGTDWTIDYSTNPAWVTYDILTQPVFAGDDYSNLQVIRYEGLSPKYLDLDSFLEFAQYCDEVVPLASGLGSRPRHTFNGGFTNENNVFEDASKVLVNCRSQLILDLSTGKFRIITDKPAIPVQMFTMGSIIEGSFKGSYLPRDQRATAIEARYIDADSEFSDLTVYVQSDMQNSDKNVVAIPFYGITNADELISEATYRLNRNVLLTEGFTFEVDIKGLTSSVGDLIYFQHEVLMPEKSGHILSVTGTDVVINKEMTLEAGFTYYLYVHKKNQPMEVSPGQFMERVENKEIASIAGDTITLVSPFAVDPEPMDEFMLVKNEPKLYRVTNIHRSNELQAEISVLEYNEDVYAGSAVTVTPVIPPAQVKVSPVRNLSAVRNGEEIYVTWQSPEVTDGFWGVEIWVMFSTGSGWTLVSSVPASFYSYKPTNPAIEYVFKVVSVYNTGFKSSFESSPAYTVPKTSEYVNPVVYHDVRVTGLSLKDRPNQSIFQTRSAEFSWNLVSATYNEEEIGDLPAGSEITVANFSHHKVVIKNMDGTVRREVKTTDTRYVYSYEDNYSDSDLGPVRKFKIEVSAVDIHGHETGSTFLYVENPIPGQLQNVSLEPGISSVILNWSIPDPLTEPDIAGYKVWSSTNSGFVIDDSNLVYQGSNNMIVLKTDLRLYVRVAAYDNFGSETSILAVSDELSAMPLPPAGSLTNYNLDYVNTSDFEITLSGNTLIIPDDKYIAFREQEGESVGSSTNLTNTSAIYYVSFDFFGWAGGDVNFTVSTAKPAISYYKFLFATARYVSGQWTLTVQVPERMASAAIFQAGSITTDLIGFNYATSSSKGGPATAALSGLFNYAYGTSQGGSATTVIQNSGTSNVVTKNTAGLYMDGQGLGYHDGTQWMSYITIAGDAFFRKSCIVGEVSANNYMQFNASNSTMTIRAKSVDVGGQSLSFKTEEFSGESYGRVSGARYLSFTNNNNYVQEAFSLSTGGLSASIVSAISGTQYLADSSHQPSGFQVRSHAGGTVALVTMLSAGVMRDKVKINLRDRLNTAYLTLDDSAGSLTAKLRGFILENCSIAGSFSGNLNGATLTNSTINTSTINNSTLANCVIDGNFAGSVDSKSSRVLANAPGILSGADVRWSGLMMTHWGSFAPTKAKPPYPEPMITKTSFGSSGLVACMKKSTYSALYTLTLYDERGEIGDNRYIVHVLPSTASSANTVSIGNAKIASDGFFANGEENNIAIFRRDGEQHRLAWSFIAYRVLDRRNSSFA